MIGTLKKARQEHICQACYKPILKGELYDYSDGWSATYHNEYGEPERTYYQFKVHIKCEEELTQTIEESEYKLPF